MATRTIVQLIDDVDGTQADDIETVVFSIDGTDYEIDLTPKNRKALDKVLTPYVDKARRLPSRGRATPRRTGPTRSTEARSDRVQKMRDWARANGYSVADRGRVPTQVQEAYAAASNA